MLFKRRNLWSISACSVSRGEAALRAISLFAAVEARRVIPGWRFVARDAVIAFGLGAAACTPTDMTGASGSRIVVAQQVADRTWPNGSGRLHSGPIQTSPASQFIADFPNGFLGLNKERIFFRHKGKLFMANARGEGGVGELILESGAGRPRSAR